MKHCLLFLVIASAVFAEEKAPVDITLENGEVLRGAVIHSGNAFLVKIFSEEGIHEVRVQAITPESRKALGIEYDLQAAEAAREEMGKQEQARQDREALRQATERDAERPALEKAAGEKNFRELVQAYKANPIAADAKYKGKELMISGQVEYIARDVLGRPFLSLGKVTAYFPASAEAEIARLGKGQAVTLVGVVDGDTLGVLSLGKCQLK